jgi:elongation factor P
VDVPDLEEKKMSFLYQDETGYCFMDTQTYDQMTLTDDQMEEALGYLKENVEVEVLLHNGKAIGIELPMFLNLKIVETDPGLKGNTASGGSKPAKLETGVTIQVPLFVSTGEVVKVDTRTGNYIERVS